MKVTHSSLRQFLLIFIIAALVLIIPLNAYSGIIFSGKDKGEIFEVYDRSRSRIIPVINSKLYMSIKFDLVTADVSNMIEPEGLSTVHIAHYSNPDVIKLIKDYYIPGIYSNYQTTLRIISAKMNETNKKIQLFLKSSSDKSRKDMTPGEIKLESEKWKKIDKLTDDMTKFYADKRNELLKKIDEDLTFLYQKNAYKTAEMENAKFRIKMTRIREIGLGCFSMAGSATRIAFADIGSIISLLDQTKDMFIWCKNNFNRGADDLYDDYLELEEALNALSRSTDEGRIRSNLSRVEKVYMSYIKLTDKFDSNAIDRIVNIQQFFQQINEIENALDTIKKENNINNKSLGKFTDLKKKFTILKNSEDQLIITANAIKEALEAADEIRITKARMASSKTTELKRLESSRKSGKMKKTRGFASIISRNLSHVENIVSTLAQIKKWSIPVK